MFDNVNYRVIISLLESHERWKKMINRETAPVEQTWDLTTLFKDEASYEAALAQLDRKSVV